LSSFPDFLPALVSTNGSWPTVLNRLYSVFKEDIVSLRFGGMKVITDNRILPDGDGKEEGFWHLITRMDRDREKRLLDPRRAERLRWIRSIIENHDREEVLVFEYREETSRKGLRTYFWLSDHNYVIILQKRGRVYVLLTAYFISSNNVRNDLRRKYKESQK